MVNEDQAKYGIQQLGEMNQVISILERQLNKKDDQIIFLQDQLIKAQGTRKNSEPAHWKVSGYHSPGPNRDKTCAFCAKMGNVKSTQ